MSPNRLYLKSIVVFVLCTLFVLGFVLVLNYVTAGVGNTSQGTTTSASACPTPSPSTPGFTVTSAALHTVNYTDELGIVNYATLAFNIDASPGPTLSSLLVCIGNTRATTVQGPFSPGTSRLTNLTLPATISISPGKTYTVNFEGVYENGSAVWESVSVPAR